MKEAIKQYFGTFSKEEIVSMCRTELSEHGYVFLKEKFPETDENNLDLAMPELIKSGEFMVDPTPFQKKWVLRKNPNYKSKWHDVKLALTTGLITLVAGLLLWLIDNQSKRQELKELKDKIERIDSLLKKS